MNLEEYKKQFTSFDDAVFGKGGYKEVYRATHSQYGDVVVKILMHGLDERSKREIDIVSKNDFANVPRIFDVNTVEYGDMETVAIVEQYVSGQTLSNLIASGKQYNLIEATDFLEQSLRFIDVISSKSIVHRDIKPNNIILSDDDTLYFLDFGIARVLDESSITVTNGQAPFTPGYAAPEVISSQKDLIDSRADLFSIGVVTYELVTGKNPFTEDANNILSVLLNTITITPMDLTIPGDTQSLFVGLISSLMNKRLSSRPSNAKQALRWLEAAKQTYSTEALR